MLCTITLHMSFSFCFIIIISFLQAIKDLEPEMLQSLLKVCRKAFMFDGFPANYSELISVDLVKKFSDSESKINNHICYKA